MIIWIILEESETLQTKAIYRGNVFCVHVCWQQQNFSDSLTIIILAAVLTFNLKILHSQTILSHRTVMCLLSSFDFFCSIDFFPAENLIHCASIAFILTLHTTMQQNRLKIMLINRTIPAEIMWLFLLGWFCWWCDFNRQCSCWLAHVCSMQKMGQYRILLIKTSSIV